MSEFGQILDKRDGTLRALTLLATSRAKQRQQIALLNRPGLRPKEGREFVEDY